MKRLSILLLIAIGAFAQTAPPAPAKKAATAPPKTAAHGKEEPTADRPRGLYWIINTSMGTITAQLYEKEAPATVANFVALTRGTKDARDEAGGKRRAPGG